MDTKTQKEKEDALFVASSLYVAIKVVVDRIGLDNARVALSQDNIDKLFNLINLGKDTNDHKR